MDKKTKLVIALYYLTLGLYFVLPKLAPMRLWGLTTWGFLPDNLVFALLAVGLLVPPLLLLSTKKLGSAEFNPDYEEESYWQYSLYSIPILLTFVVSFFIFHANTHFLGDGYEVLKDVASGRQIMKAHSYGEILLHRLVYSWLSDDLAARARLTFTIVSGLSGVIFIVLSWIAAKALTSGTLYRILFLLGMSSSGFMLLFFGYVENYSVFVLVVLAFTLIGVGAMKQRVSRWWPLVLVSVAAFFHIFGIVLLPAALYVLLSRSNILSRFKRINQGMKLTSFSVIVVAAMITYFYLSQEFLFFRFAVLPIIPDQYTVAEYTMFSSDHLLDFVNLILLLIPGAVLLLIAAVGSFRNQLSADPVIRFLSVFTISAIAVAFLLDPKLGMPRDWDLFAFVGIPLSVLVYYSVIKSPDLKVRYLAVALSILLGLLTLAPRVYCQVVPSAGIAQVRDYFELDVKKSMQYIKIAQDYCLEHGDSDNYRELSDFYNKNYPEKTLNSQGKSLLDGKRYAEAISYFDQAISINPRLVGAFFNKGLCLIYTGRFVEAEEVLEIAVGLNPNNAKMHGHLALAQMRANRLEEAVKNALSAHDLDNDDLLPISLLIQIYKSTGRQNEYQKFLMIGANNPQAPPQLLAELTALYIQKREFGLARQTLREAISKGLDSSIAAQLKARIR